MIELDGTQTDRLAAPARGVTYLIDVDLSTGVLYFCLWPVNISAAGHNYIGAGDVLTVAALSESAQSDASQLAVHVNVVNTDMLAWALGPASVYRGRSLRIALQLLDEQNQPVGAPIPRWAGYMSKTSVKREANDDGEVTGYIEVSCVRAGLSRFRNDEGMRLTHAQQQQRFPGDMGLQYMQGLIDQPITWLTKRFQQV